MSDTNRDPVAAQSPATNVEAPDGSAPVPSFNVFRFRKMSENQAEFYDPVTDILSILPQAIQATMETLDGLLQDTSDSYSDACIMAANIHQLFQIRLIEQKDSIEQVLAEFMQVFKSTPVWLRAMFTETLFFNLMTMWAVANRRAASGKTTPLVAPQDEMRLGSLLSYLKPDTRSQVLLELLQSHRSAISSLHVPASQENIYFTDEHGNVILEDAKKFVASIVPIKDGPQTWDSIAKALESMEVKTPQDQAVQETYPSYIK